MRATADGHTAKDARRNRENEDRWSRRSPGIGTVPFDV